MNKLFFERISNYLYTIVLTLIIFIGWYLRIRLFMLNPGLHHDEANLALNMIEYSYSEFFMPLERNQVCPPFFLIISKLIYNFVNFNYSARFSDMLLRVLPMLSGLAVLPFFAYLLSKLFKNKLLTLAGTLFLALNDSTVYYSCVFKQYSSEILVSLVLIFLAYNINFKDEKFFSNLVIFFIMGLSALLSFSSYFILTGIFLYLLYLYFKLNNRKQILSYIVAMCVPAFLIGLSIIIPFYTQSSKFMNEYWTGEFGLNFAEFIGVFFYNFLPESETKIFYAAVAVVISCGIMLKENLRLFFIIALPLILTFFVSYFGFYPAEMRLLLFIYPALIIIFLYIFSFIKILKNNFVNLFSCILIFIYLGFFIYNPPSTESFILKPDVARDVWEYFEKNYDNKTLVIFAGSKNSQIYYNKFFAINKYPYVFSDDTNWFEMYQNIPPGMYYIISDFSKSYNFYLKRKLLADTDILEYKIFISPWIRSKNKYGWYMKFIKSY